MKIKIDYFKTTGKFYTDHEVSPGTSDATDSWRWIKHQFDHGHAPGIVNRFNGTAVVTIDGVPRVYGIAPGGAEIVEFRSNSFSHQMKEALERVLCERLRQDTKWGLQNHDPHKWLTIWMEEVGEFSKAVLEAEFGGDPEEILTELTDACAVSLAMIECAIRNKWNKGELHAR